MLVSHEVGSEYPAPLILSEAQLTAAIYHSALTSR